MLTKPKEPRKVKCPNCKYVWWTKSDKMYITCSNCLHKFKEEKKDGKTKI